MELKGRFNSKMIKKAQFGDVYFDDMGAFLSMERDKVLGTVISLSTFLSFKLTCFSGCGEEGAYIEAGQGSARAFDAWSICEDEG